MWGRDTAGRPTAQVRRAASGSQDAALGCVSSRCYRPLAISHARIAAGLECAGVRAAGRRARRCLKDCAREGPIQG